jgi:hypothetical protein
MIPPVALKAPELLKDVVTFNIPEETVIVEFVLFVSEVVVVAVPPLTVIIPELEMLETDKLPVPFILKELEAFEILTIPATAVTPEPTTGILPEAVAIVILSAPVGTTPVFQFVASLQSELVVPTQLIPAAMV